MVIDDEYILEIKVRKFRLYLQGLQTKQAVYH